MESSVVVWVATDVILKVVFMDQSAMCVSCMWGCVLLYINNRENCVHLELEYPPCGQVIFSNFCQI